VVLLKQLTIKLTCRGGVVAKDAKTKSRKNANATTTKTATQTIKQLRANFFVSASS
jgi:hypothetical protein